jgi:hypothetical protein
MGYASGLTRAPGQAAAAPARGAQARTARPAPCGNQALLRRLQAKLKVGAVNDPLEHEADRVADQVMRMPAPGTATTSAPPQVSRKCDKCEEEEKLQKKEAGPQAATGEAPSSVHEVLRSPGQPLDAATRAFFEPRFGRDFSDVRVHSGPSAAQSAGALDALAYAVGRDIVFGAGQYASNTYEGRRLLAHELTHVAQCDGSASGTERGPIVFRQKKDTKPQPQPCHPSFKSLKAEITGSIGVRETDEGRCQLMLGEPHKSNGTTITAVVNVPADCNGTLQFVQLVESCHSIRVSEDKDDIIHKKTDGFWIDTMDPIDEKPVSAAGDVTFTTNDSPGQGAAGRHVHVDDKFKTWLLWKPTNPADAVRIPLAVVTWSWGAEADATGNPGCSKGFTVSAEHHTGGTGAAISTLPSSKNIAPTDEKTEKGPC